MKIEGALAFGDPDLLLTIQECCALLRRAKHCFNQSDINTIAIFKREFNVDEGQVYYDYLLGEIASVEINNCVEADKVITCFEQSIKSAHLNEPKNVLYRLDTSRPPESSVVKNNDYYAGVEICANALSEVLCLIETRALRQYNDEWGDLRAHELTNCINIVKEFATKELNEWLESNNCSSTASKIAPTKADTSFTYIRQAASALLLRLRPQIDFANDCLRGIDVIDGGEYIGTTTNPDLTLKAYLAFKVIYDQLEPYITSSEHLTANGEFDPDIRELHSIKSNYFYYKEQFDFMNALTNGAAKSPLAEKATASTKTLASFIVKDKDVIIQKIERIIPSCKGKKIATIIRALQDLGCITLASGEYKQLYRAIRAHYNIDIGADSGITKYLSGANQIPERELEDMKKQLQ